MTRKACFKTCGWRLTVWRGGVEGPGPSTTSPVIPYRGKRSRAFETCLSLRAAMRGKGSSARAFRGWSGRGASTGRGVGIPGFHAPYVFTCLPGAWAACPRRRDAGVPPSLAGAGVTPDPHAAPPHTDGMNVRLFLGGRSPPRPSHRVEGWGNPVPPHPSPRAYVHVRSEHLPRDPADTPEGKATTR